MKKAMKQSKLTYLLNAISITAMILGVVFCVGIIVLSEDATKANDNRYDLTRSATQFLNASANLTNQVRAYAATANEENYNNYLNEVNTQKNREKALETMKAIGITPEEQAKIEQAAKISNELVPVEEQAMDYVKTNQKVKALELVYGQEYNQSIAQIRALEAELITMLDERTNEGLLIKRRQINNIGVEMLMAIGTVVVCQISSLFIIRKKIILPIIALEKQSIEISKGNLSTELLLEADTSEIGMLVYSMKQIKSTLKTYISDINDKLNEMSNNNFAISIDVDYIGDFLPIKNALIKIIASLNEAMFRINRVAAEVAVGADQVSAGAQALSQGATEQASSIEELAATISEVSNQLKDSAVKAMNANDLSNESTEKVSYGNKEMESMLLAMKKIDESSKKIGNIIKTINDISMQTNILALNAAVEATRGGVAGKGFAVVAAEVRNLATKSSAAAKETTFLIEQSEKAVEHGTQIANATAQTLNEVILGAEQTTNLMGEIAATSEIQSEAVEQIMVGIDQISAVVQNNSATAQESAASSEELSSQAQVLKDLVGGFRLAHKDNNIIEARENLFANIR